MEDRDWTGTAAAIAAVAMTAGVWLWNPNPPPPRHSAADDHATQELAQWRDEALRWSMERSDGTARETQLSSVSPGAWTLPEDPVPIAVR
jgi:hypothetical protein